MTDMPSKATLSPPYLANHGKPSDISWLYMLHNIFSNGPNSGRNYAYKWKLHITKGTFCVMWNADLRRYEGGYLEGYFGVDLLAVLELLALSLL